MNTIESNRKKNNCPFKLRTCLDVLKTFNSNALQYSRLIIIEPS